MQRILATCAGLMGLWVMGLTLLLAGRRATADPNPALLMIAERNHQQQLYLVGGTIWHPLGPPLGDLQPYPQQPDGAWLYLRAITKSDRWQESVLRVRRDATRVETLPPAVPQIWDWSPDGNWLFFTDGIDLFRARADGGAVQNLTAQFTPTVGVNQYAALVLAPDSAWVVLAAINPSGVTHLYRVEVASGQATDLTPHASANTTLLGAVQDGAWLAYHGGNGFYWIRPDGSETQLARGDGTFHQDYGAIWSAADLLLVQSIAAQDTSVLYAYAVGVKTPRWTLPTTLGTGSVAHPSLALRTVENELYRVLPNDTPSLFYRMPHMAGFVAQYELSPDGQHLAYIYQPVLPESSGSQVLYLKSADVTDALAVHQSDQTNLAIVAWLTEGLAFQETIGPNQTLWLWRSADGQKVRLVQTTATAQFVALADLPQHPVGLPSFLGGAVLLGTAIGAIRFRRPAA